ncbi:hypothetical protein K435DRAFT_495626 [Dendrothele bispora CBS 962.96]|uniref:Uncharacterized protein n=1 Tax=Dendrothele bispora (strain CBS 962.96) TaxID=1314807 RepID=A0A4S8KXC8_DENBC|nr:hypothetical protein K435DRAFT_495626 [Dendrothele bispora CBS 962.96]
MQSVSDPPSPTSLTITYAPPKAVHFLLDKGPGLDPKIFNHILVNDLLSLKLPAPAQKRTRLIADGCVELLWKKDDVKVLLQRRLDPKESKGIRSDILRTLLITKIELRATRTHWIIEDSNPVTDYSVYKGPSIIPFSGFPAPSLKRKRDDDQDQPARGRIYVDLTLTDVEEGEITCPQSDTRSNSVSNDSNREFLLRIEELERQLKTAQSDCKNLENENNEVSQVLEMKETEWRAMMQDKELELDRLSNELRKAQEGGTARTELQLLRKQLEEAETARERCEESFKGKISRLEEKRKREKEAHRVLREDFARLQRESQETTGFLSLAEAALKSATKQMEEAQAATDHIRLQSEKRQAADEAARLCYQDESKRQQDEIERLTELLHESEEARECERKGQDELMARYLELEESLTKEKMNREKAENAFYSLQQDYHRLEADKIARDKQAMAQVELEMSKNQAEDTEERSQDGLVLFRQGPTCHEQYRTISSFEIGTQAGYLSHLFK